MSAARPPCTAWESEKCVLWGKNKELWDQACAGWDSQMPVLVKAFLAFFIRPHGCPVPGPHCPGHFCAAKDRKGLCEGRPPRASGWAHFSTHDCWGFGSKQFIFTASLKTHQVILKNSLLFKTIKADLYPEINSLHSSVLQ